MKRLQTLGVLLGACAGAAFGQNLQFANPDFEVGQPGETPSGWFVPKVIADEGFRAVLTTNQPASGKLCVELRWPTNGTAPGSFGNLMQQVDAAPWRNKRIKVTAAIRVASGQDAKRAQMWLRVDRPDGTGAFDNMYDRPVRRRAWADYSITADVANDARAVSLGLMTFAGETAWWDHVRVEVV